MNSTELGDFARAAEATHCYTDQQIVDYFLRLMNIVSHDDTRAMVGIVREYRIAVFRALLREGVIGSKPQDDGNDGGEPDTG